MVKYPNLFKPRMKDLGAHNQKYAQSPWEWWYFDAIFDNGYSIASIWMVPVTPAMRAPYGTISMDIVYPDGTAEMVETPLEKEDVTVSYDHCDVTAGSNYVRGKLPKYKLHHKVDDDHIFDLVFESQTQGVQEPPTGCFIGRDIPPATRTYMGWSIVMPRAKVTGTLTLKGKKIPVSGMGYHDHQWGSVHLVDGMLEDSHIFEYWYWGRCNLDEYTLDYWDGQLRAELGGDRFKRLVVLKGEKLVEYLTDGVYTDVAEIRKDEATGIEYPGKTVMTVVSDTINGQLTMKPKKSFANYCMPPRSGYIRYVCDAKGKFEIAGKKVDATSEMINELLFFTILPK
jgi:hypothetical protein